MKKPAKIAIAEQCAETNILPLKTQECVGAFSDDDKSALVRDFFDAADSFLAEQNLANPKLEDHVLIAAILDKHPHPDAAIMLERLLGAFEYLIAEGLKR